MVQKKQYALFISKKQTFSLASVLERGYKLISEKRKTGKIALSESPRRRRGLNSQIFRRFFTLSEYNLSERKTAGEKKVCLKIHNKLQAANCFRFIFS
ncbi:MAG: hypothetical protein D4Q79_02090 [Spirochaetia bacterium]|nr:MAG: hypothetical protein D4Q79_02090 [Spirochaetia bacterium]